MKKKKRNFSSFDLADAYKELRLTRLLEWTMEVTPVAPTDFYIERINRLKNHFDITTSERAKELLIDAICDEALLSHANLKMWKAAAITSDELIGSVDYVAAPNRGYLEHPLLCVVEAKKDDFEQGLAQCLVEMKACQESNAKVGNKIEIYGVVTNGEGWKFYKLTKQGQVYESYLYAIGEIDEVLGCLHYIFTQCENNIASFAKAA